MRFLFGLVIGLAVGFAVGSSLAGAGFPLASLFREPKAD
jgi:hypothetical protein